jgi:hypothetical protein
LQISAEIRWFWPNTPPAGLEDWFRNAEAHGCVAGGGKSRLDEYLRDPKQLELGLKRRGGRPGVEVKGLISAEWGGLAVTPFFGPIELWTKWTSEPLVLNPNSTLAVQKLRWMRKFETGGAVPLEISLDPDENPRENWPLPQLGCNVEFTTVTLPDSSAVWWTLGFEAFGTIHTVELHLRAVATTLAARGVPTFRKGSLASYPAWLNIQSKET